MNRLQEFRLERGYMHQADLAAATGIPYIDGPMISRFETDKALPTPEVAEIISKLVGREIAAIWPEYPSRVRIQAPTAEKRVQAFANGSGAKNYNVVTLHIPVGKRNATSWQEIHDITGLSERTIRQHIEDARNDGLIILNDGEGYYTPESLDDIKRSFYRDMRIVNKIVTKNVPLRRIIKEHSQIDGQLTLSFCVRCWEPVEDGELCASCEAILKDRAADQSETRQG